MDADDNIVLLEERVLGPAYPDVHQPDPMKRRHVTVNGNPGGGSVDGPGLGIDWQNGPMARESLANGAGTEATVAIQTGALVEDVILAALDRLRWYQQSRFACPENGEAIWHLEEALTALRRRHVDRTARGVAGKHEL